MRFKDTETQRHKDAEKDFVTLSLCVSTKKGENMKNKNTIILIVGVVALITFWFIGKYNGLVNKEENVNSKWAQVENVYQRRADLIPNLVATVKGYAEHEQQVLTDVVAARAKATSVNFNADNMTEENIKAFQAAQDQLSGALSRLLVTVEKYAFFSNPNMLATMLVGNLRNPVLYSFTASLKFLRSTEMRFSVPSNCACNSLKLSFAFKSGYFSTVTKSLDNAPDN